MSNESFWVEGVEVNCISMRKTTASIIADAQREKSFGVFTLNLDHVVKLRRDKDFRASYRNARYVTADGFPIVWAGRLRRTRAERVTGADLIEPLCEAASKAGLSVFLFGSTFQSLAGAARHLTTRYPGLEIAGIASPIQGFDPKSQSAVDYAKMIAESGAKICFVGLGAPKQELFAATALAGSEGSVAFVCIGAGLDFLAGVQVRAPRWAQVANTEWMWRLLSNPRRFGRRYLDCFTLLPSVLAPSLTGHRVGQAVKLEAPSQN